MRQAVSVATRLSRRAIKAIGSVANMLCPDIILSNKELNKDNLKSTDSIMSKYDCRIFKRFLCTSSLRGARHFMNAVRENAEEAQVSRAQGSSLV